MPKRTVNLPRGAARDGIEIVSHGRRGPTGTLPLTTAQVEQVARTVRRVPEVVVKVSGGARDVGGAKAHLDYIDRHGKLGLETDDGRIVQGKEAGKDLVDDWNLDLSKGQYRAASTSGKDLRPKLVHNIVLSMPGRTPPEAVLQAARKFAREHFALQYRYAMVLHTDQNHPHVHLVVKAEHEYEQGKRLYINKAMLRQWREDFAQCLREQGVAANATPACVRGRPKDQKKDAIHHRLRAAAAFEALPDVARAGRQAPAESTFMRGKVGAIARELQDGTLAADLGKAKLVETRLAVLEGWREMAKALRAQGEDQLAAEVEAFVRALPQVRTERERIAAGLLAQIDAQRDHGRGAEPDAAK